MKRLAALWLCTCSSLLAQGTLSLEQISTDRGLWPTEVMVVVDHNLPVTENGKTRSRKVGPGKTYPLVSIDAKSVTIDSSGTPLTFKADETDLIARAEQIKALREAPAPAPAPVPNTQIDPPNSGPRMIAVDSAPAAESASTSQQAGSSKTSAGSNVMAQKLAGLLVRNNNGSIVPYDAANLSDKKFLAVYFSASWCGPCRRFTPAFVQWYAQSRAKADNFEVIFVSLDEDERSMANYMMNDRMEWPAVSFGKRSNNPLLKYSGKGIPCLAILDSSGSVVSHSYSGEKYIGPNQPLKELDRLLGGL